LYLQKVLRIEGLTIPSGDHDLVLDIMPRRTGRCYGLITMRAMKLDVCSGSNDMTETT